MPQTAAKRREKIEKTLRASDAPVTATSLAKTLGVSRQIIVGDIALLRASGFAIDATPRGYMLAEKNKDAGKVYTIACIHDKDHMRDELYAIVDNGCEVLDVVIEHKVYGQLTGMLRLKSRYDVEQFIKKLGESDAPLSTITGGIHIHNLACPDEEAFERVKGQLDQLGILLKS